MKNGDPVQEMGREEEVSPEKMAMDLSGNAFQNLQSD